MNNVLLIGLSGCKMGIINSSITLGYVIYSYKYCLRDCLNRIDISKTEFAWHRKTKRINLAYLPLFSLRRPPPFYPEVQNELNI